MAAAASKALNEGAKAPLLLEKAALDLTPPQGLQSDVLQADLDTTVGAIIIRSG